MDDTKLLYEWYLLYTRHKCIFAFVSFQIIWRSANANIEPVVMLYLLKRVFQDKGLLPNKVETFWIIVYRRIFTTYNCKIAHSHRMSARPSTSSCPVYTPALRNAHTSCAPLTQARQANQWHHRPFLGSRGGEAQKLPPHVMVRPFLLTKVLQIGEQMIIRKITKTTFHILGPLHLLKERALSESSLAWFFTQSKILATTGQVWRGLRADAVPSRDLL